MFIKTSERTFPKMLSFMMGANSFIVLRCLEWWALSLRNYSKIALKMMGGEKGERGGRSIEILKHANGQKQDGEFWCLPGG